MTSMRKAVSQKEMVGMGKELKGQKRANLGGTMNDDVFD